MLGSFSMRQSCNIQPRSDLQMSLRKIVLSLTTIGFLLEASSALAYTVIDSDQVQPIYTGASALEMYYQPLLAVSDSGCVPFPAVDSSGDVSGGLKPTGAPDGDCTSSVGQVYSRYASYYNMCAIMYSWF